MKLGIASASGSARGVFIHGVLASFENHGIVADVYAASSSSSVPSAYAAIHRLPLLKGTEYWRTVRSRYVERGSDMGAAVKDGIAGVISDLRSALFDNNASRFAVAVSEVVNAKAAELTQGDGARRLGKQLMLSIRSQDSSWAKENLKARLFDTRTESSGLRITATNLSEILYATTRMLHAWKDPAWIDGRPFIDASYTCVVPAIELANLGMDLVIAISPEPGPIYRDFFRSELIPESWNKCEIRFIQPEQDLGEMGVDYLMASDDGLETAFELGVQAGENFAMTL